MASNTPSFSAPVFNGEKYHAWAVKMKAYLRGQGLWQYVEEEKQPPQLGPNPTLNQIRIHEEEAAKAPRALFCIHSAITETVFTRIMACETPKEAWDKLKEEFVGSEKTRNMQIMNLRREFEVLKMQEAETVKEYVDRLMSVVNKIRLLGEELTDKRIVEKVLVSLPERFEAKISSLEDSKDLSQISLAELVHSLQAQEQRRLLRQEDTSEGAMVASQKGRVYQKENRKYAGEKKGKEKSNFVGGKSGGMKSFPPCSHCKKKNHPENRCWFRPGIQCRSCKQFGHIEKVCKNKGNQQEQQAQVVENQQPNQEEERLFMASCSKLKTCDDVWLIDSGCTNHMTPLLTSFVSLDHSYQSRVKIGNGNFVEVKGRGEVTVPTSSGTKYISNVLYVPEINQSLLSVGQMLEKNYSLHFQNKSCIVVDSCGKELMRVRMLGKSFPVEWRKSVSQA